MEDRGKQPVNGPWAARAPLSLISAAASLRLIPGVSACVVSDDLWLRGDDLNQSMVSALNRLAPTARFAVLSDGQLVPHGRELPQGRLPPDAAWTPLADLLQPKLVSAALPAVPIPPVQLRLERSYEALEATVLIASLRDLADYAHDAPAVRLNRLRFAADSTRALVWGEPLPPLPGERYTERSGIAAPCGFQWRPAIDPPSLRRLLSLAEGDLALLGTDGNWQQLPATAFVRASRSAIRFTVGARQGVKP